MNQNANQKENQNANQNTNQAMHQEMNQVLGRHLLVEFYNCTPELLDDTAGIEAHMNEAARVCGATIVQSVFHRFSPWGVSGVVVISESHLAIHTWPEYGYASVDLYTCGDTVDPMIACDYLKQALGAGQIEFQAIQRGNLAHIQQCQQRPPFMQTPGEPAAPSAIPFAVAVTPKPENDAQPMLVKGGAA